MSEQTQKIQLMGKKFAVKCPPEQRQLMHHAVHELERRLGETQQNARLQNDESVILMTALNMACDLLEQKAQLDLIQADRKRKSG